VKKIHETQQKLLKLLKDNIDNPLTIRELGEQIGEESAGVVHHHIVQLEKKGYLKRNPEDPKDYVIMDEPDKAVVYLNKYGLARCGPGGQILSGRPVARIPIATSILRFPAAEAFIVEARGDSMEPKIKPGDTVIAKKQGAAEHGEIIVCVHDEQPMIKKYFSLNGVVCLQSLNMDKTKHPDIPVTDPDKFKIEGLVKNILRYDFL
jgi:repressor LexA